ncbi:MAG: AAA family ATPase [Mariprofundus sp.]|nr:AAA family ATPase [Mariprofundus sp.]
MYLKHFGLKELPFSIAPNPRYLYFTHQHQEALAHLVYGLNSAGGIILLTGEVGTGKTTISRKLLEDIPGNIDIAWIVNPRLSVEELLAAICDELGIDYPDGNSSIKIFTDLISAYLIHAHGNARNVVLMIDEAQNLSPEVLEQLRLLTNLETSERKLLQIVLLGQPELKTMLDRTDLRQLAQRITARYHLHPLSKVETREYIRHRLAVGGCNKTVFSQRAINLIHHLSHGTPRLINLLCDRALLGVYSANGAMVCPKHVRQASSEVLGKTETPKRRFLAPVAITTLLIATVAIVATGAWQKQPAQFKSVSAIQGTPSPTSETELKHRNTATGKIVHSPLPDQIAESAAINTQETLPAADIARQTTKKASNVITATGKSGIIPASSAKPWKTIEETGTKTLAFQTLAGIWHTGLASTEGQPCNQLMNKKLFCLSQRTNLWLLQKFDRPAIFRIIDHAGGLHYAVIRSASNGHAVIQLDRQQWSIRLSELKQRWQDSMILIWMKPPGYKKDLQKGDSGKAVEWLVRQLDHIQGRMIPPGQSHTMDAILEERLKYFQKSEGIPPDGIAGALTLMRINERIGLDSPRLQSQATN